MYLKWKGIQVLYFIILSTIHNKTTQLTRGCRATDEWYSYLCFQKIHNISLLNWLDYYYRVNLNKINVIASMFVHTLIDCKIHRFISFICIFHSSSTSIKETQFYVSLLLFICFFFFIIFRIFFRFHQNNDPELKKYRALDIHAIKRFINSRKKKHWNRVSPISVKNT